MRVLAQTSANASMTAASTNLAMEDTSVTPTVLRKESLHTTAVTIQTISSRWDSLHVPKNAKVHFVSASEAEHLISNFNLFVFAIYF